MLRKLIFLLWDRSKQKEALIIVHPLAWVKGQLDEGCEVCSEQNGSLWLSDKLLYLADSKCCRSLQLWWQHHAVRMPLCSISWKAHNNVWGSNGCRNVLGYPGALLFRRTKPGVLSRLAKKNWVKLQRPHTRLLRPIVIDSMIEVQGASNKHWLKGV